MWSVADIGRHSPLAKGALVLLLAVLAVVPGAAGAQTPLSSRKRYAQPPRLADKSVKRDLLSILAPVRALTRGSIMMYIDQGLTTRPYGADYDGLCRRDALLLKYAPVGPHSMDAPMQPYGLEAKATYHIVRLPRGEPANDPPRNHALQASCDALDGDDKANWFEADTAFQAVQGASALVMAVGEIKAGKLKAERCRVYDPKVSCENAIVAKGKISDIWSIKSCDAPPVRFCYAIDVGMTVVTITGVGDGSKFEPDAIASIKAEDYVVVT